MIAIDHTFFETNVHCLISTFAYMEEHNFDDEKLNSEADLTALVVHGMLFMDDIPFIAQSFKKFIESVGGVAAFRSRPMYEYSVHAIAAIYFMTIQTRCRKTSSLACMNQAQAAKIFGDLFNTYVGNRSIETRVVRRLCKSSRTTYCIDYYECNNLYQEIKPDEAKTIVSLLKERIYDSLKSSVRQSRSYSGAQTREGSVLDELDQVIHETSGYSPKAKEELGVDSPLKQSELSLVRRLGKKTSANLDENDNLQKDCTELEENCTRILRSNTTNKNQTAALLRSSEVPPQAPQNEIDENIIACVSSDIASLYTSLLAHKKGMSSVSFIENISLCLARMIKLLGVNFRYQIELTPSDIVKMLPTGVFEEYPSIVKQGRCRSPIPFIPQNLDTSSPSVESKKRDSMSSNSDSIVSQTDSRTNRLYAMDN